VNFTLSARGCSLLFVFSDGLSPRSIFAFPSAELFIFSADQIDQHLVFLHFRSALQEEEEECE
jgi:hypothetical protein